MADLLVDPSQVKAIEVDPSQVKPYTPPQAGTGSDGGVMDFLGSVLGTAGSDIAGMPAGLYNTVRHPIDTLSQMASPPQGQIPEAQLPQDAISRLRRMLGGGPNYNPPGKDTPTSEVIGHGLTMLPLSAAPEIIGAAKKTAPAVRAGVREAASQVRKELPAIGKTEAVATPVGAALGYMAGEPAIGTAMGATAGAIRAMPPALRGFRKGFGGYKPFLSKPMPPPPGTPAARFVPGQYDLKVVDAPVEVGGAHIPDYHGPVAGPFPEPTAMPTLEQAAVTNPNAAKVLKQTAKNMGFKDFEDMPAPVKAVILEDIAKQGVPSAGLPTLESQGASIIPEGEHAIIRKVAEVNRGNKDLTIARSLKDEGITREALDKMADADLRKRVTDLGYKPSTGKNYSRTWSAFRRDLRALIDAGEAPPSPLNPKPLPPK